MDQEHYDLYERYIAVRHSDGDMFPPSISQYDSFLVQNDEDDRALFLEGRLDGQLIAVTLFDEIPGNGLSAIYTFLQIPDGEYMAFRITIISIIISLIALIISEVILARILIANKNK